MKYVQTEGLSLPAVAVGCMGFAGAERKQLCNLIEQALQRGMNFFDHADIYGGEGTGYPARTTDPAV